MLNVSGDVRRLVPFLVFGLIIGVALGSLAGVTYYAHIDKILNLENNILSFINSIATIVLVVVTLGYVLLTYGLVAETKRARKQDVKPVMDLSLEPYALGASGPKIENIGNGPAKNVSATVKLEPGGEQGTITAKNIRPGDFAGSLDPSVGSDSHKDYEKLTVSGTFTDIFDDREEFEDEIDLEILAKSDGASSLMDRDPIERNLRKIRENIKSLSDDLDLEEISRLSKVKSRKIILDEFESERELTLRELAHRTGIHPVELSHILADLEWAGAIEGEMDISEMISETEYDKKLFYNE